MDDDHVTPISINQHSNGWYNWEVYDITPTLYGVHDNFTHDKNIILYSEEARKELTFYQGITSWVDWSHGYKGLDPSRNTGTNYYVFTLYQGHTE